MPSPKNRIIAIERLTLSYGDKVVLENINLDIHTGDFLVVTGPNGGGKTSLLRVILGLQKPTQGKVYFLPDDSSASLEIGYLPQKNSIDSHFPITVEEVIASGLMSQKQAVSRQEIDHILDLTGLTDLRHKPIGELSGGQLQRTLFGRALISRPEMLILDEPSSYLDRPFCERMREILRDLSSQGTTIMMVTHESKDFITLANHILYIDRTLEVL